MFGDTFQGGVCVDVLVAQGNVPLPSVVKSTSKCQLTRSYERDVKGNVFMLSSKTGSVPCLNIPTEKSSSLKIVQPVLCLQLNISLSSEFSLDVNIFDQSNSKRRLNFATAHKSLAITPLHTKIPLKNIPKNVWLSLRIELGSLTSGLYPGNSFKFLDSLIINSKCKLRRIFTTRDSNSTFDLPKNVDFPPGVLHEGKLLNFESFESSLVLSQRTVHSAPKKFNQTESNSTKTNVKEIVKNENVKNGSFESLGSSHGSDDLNVTGRQGISSAPVGKRPGHLSVNPQPPAPSRSGKTSSKIRARVYSNEKESKLSLSPDRNCGNQETKNAESIPSNDSGLFTFSSMPRVAPVPESLPVKPISPFGANFDQPNEKMAEIAAKETKFVPQISKKFAKALNVPRNGEQVTFDIGSENEDEKENKVESDNELDAGEVTARTNVHTPSDYDWRNYAPPDTGRSASSVEQSMLNSILDPHYQDAADTDVHNPLSAMEDLSMQSSKYNLSSRLDYLNSNKSGQLNAAMALPNFANFDETSCQIPSLENFRKGRNANALRSSPPLLLPTDVEEISANHEFKLSVNGQNVSPAKSQSGETDEELELIYDPDLNCYYDPLTQKYYELRT
ncbi:protein CFAP20DC-like [Convolutriloba macropyga]|uniref:protein CFAP20DC-like n=1 Tax=Convolutriloba macropyga TaxID=536237 RepID=UPI003F52707C